MQFKSYGNGTGAGQLNTDALQTLKEQHEVDLIAEMSQIGVLRSESKAGLDYPRRDRRKAEKQGRRVSTRHKQNEESTNTNSQ